MTYRNFKIEQMDDETFVVYHPNGDMEAMTMGIPEAKEAIDLAIAVSN